MSDAGGGSDLTLADKTDNNVHAVNERFKQGLREMVFREQALKFYRVNASKKVEQEAA
jgi:hypothetical protein